tara:strand:+ start:65 stop:421 length:357 start_codon:yes stop_codon:yes gene_type:complete
MKDKLWWILLAAAAVLMLSNARAGTWNEKPVMCDNIKIVQNLIRDKGELLIMSGIQLTKVRDPDEANGLSPTPATLPMRLYVNLETKTFTVIETHPSYGVSCVLGYGENFNSILLDTM